MPGGDGGEDFNPFVRRIHKYALGSEWIVAEPVAVYWNKAQEIVWPTKQDAAADSKFSTEEFVGMVIEDVKTRAKIDPKNIVTLTWSSSGPAGDAITLQPETPVTGSYIAMSVFRPEWYPMIAKGKDRRFLIDHSPQDRVCPYSMSVNAEKKLLEVGAEIKRIEYEGGHGWHGDVYGRIQEGMEWLTQKR
jgi:predicted esterase